MARGLILCGMKVFFTALIYAPLCALPAAAMAQDANPPKDGGGANDRVIIQIPPLGELPPPEPLEIPPLENDTPENNAPATDGETDTDMAGVIEGEEIIPEDIAPDYSKLPPQAERTAKLNDLFETLADREDEASANLVAEEIMAIWVESGSASVNLLLRRGSDAAAKGQPKLARKMYNYAVDLSPDYAEGWARSARLALTQKQYNRALNESLKTLDLEPRHFYALWTLGNVLEVLNRPDEALESYREANRLYPELKVVKDRLGELETEVEGTVL